MLDFSAAQSAPDTSAAITPWIRISFGQSHRTNSFPQVSPPASFANMGINSQAAITVQVDNIGGTSQKPGPIGGAWGIVMVGKPNGITHYANSDIVMFGRSAIVAQQLLRLRAAPNAPPIPYIEFCTACPGSSWTDGSGGGLGPGLTFTGTIVNDRLTVSNIVSVPGGGVVTKNQALVAAGIDPRTIIMQDINGHQGAGDYAIDIVQFVVESRFTTANAVFMGNIGAGNASVGNLLFIDQVLSGTVTIGDTLSAPAAPGTTIIAFISSDISVMQDDLTGEVAVAPRAGFPGGTGTYQVKIGAPQNAGPETMTVHGTAWYDQGVLLPLMQQYPVLPSGKYLPGIFKSVGYTQFGSSRYGYSTQDGGLLDLADMLGLYDAMNLPGAGTNGMIYHISQQAVISNGTVLDGGQHAKYLFCRQHAPGMGGTWSGRCFANTPIYPWPMDGISNTHLDPWGSTRASEWEAYVAYQVEDLGNTSWTPLWRPLTGGAITRSGQVLTVPFARPNSTDFAATPLVFKPAEAVGDTKVWPQNGFHVKRGAADLTVTPTIAGLNVLLTIAEAINAGDRLEVSYSYYGPGGSNPGITAGVGGNLCMVGPQSVFYPDRTIDAWAWPFLETVTV